MVYKNDGTPHKNGIEGENVIVIFFNDKLNYDFISSSINRSMDTNKIFKPFNFVKKGGTQNRVDIFCENNNVSISIKTKKKEKNKYKGTFDLINTSCLEDFTCENKEYFKSIDNWLNWTEKIKNKRYSYLEIKKEVENYCRSILNEINGKQIENIFKRISEIEGNNIEVIRDYKDSVNEKIEEKSIHFLKYNWFNEEFKNTIDKTQNINSSKTSAFIKTIDGKNSFFRIRVVTNNGVSALMRGLGILSKIGGKNNNSQMTLKIQVDKVLEVIKKYDVNLIYENR